MRAGGGESRGPAAVGQPVPEGGPGRGRADHDRDRAGDAAAAGPAAGDRRDGDGGQEHDLGDDRPHSEGVRRAGDAGGEYRRVAAGETGRAGPEDVDRAGALELYAALVDGVVAACGGGDESITQPSRLARADGALRRI